MIEKIKDWTIIFIKKHIGKGSHRWAFWLEGILIGVLLYHFWIKL